MSDFGRGSRLSGGHSGTVSDFAGGSRPHQSRGASPPDLPKNDSDGFVNFFFIFDLKKFEEMSISEARFLIPKFLIRPAGCTFECSRPLRVVDGSSALWLPTEVGDRTRDRVCSPERVSLPCKDQAGGSPSHLHKIGRFCADAFWHVQMASVALLFLNIDTEITPVH